MAVSELLEEILPAPISRPCDPAEELFPELPSWVSDLSEETVPEPSIAENGPVEETDLTLPSWMNEIGGEMSDQARARSFIK